MLEHGAAVQQQLVQQEADLPSLPGPAVGPAVDGLRRPSPDREQVLNRLWEIANLSPAMTRGSVTGQVKALSIIVAMENFIPGRHALSSQRSPAAHIDPQPAPAPGQQEDVPATPARPGGQPTLANRFTPSQAPKICVPLFTSVPDLGIPLSIKKAPFNPFVHPR